MSETPVAAGQAGTIARQGFNEQSLEAVAETAGSALAARARALVEARFIVAMRRPRDWDDVRTRLLRACERPGFAGHAVEKVWGAAWYAKPVGEGVEGFSIRFAEEAVRCMGNLDVEAVTVYDDERKRIVTVTVTDLESNAAYQASLTLDKTVERRFLKKGEEALRVRMNSKGQPTYTLPATDDDVFSKQQNLTSKAIRNAVLRLLPGDIQAECRARILEIRVKGDAKDLDGARKKMVDSFALLNILPSALKEFLGHELGNATPEELAGLRELYTALKDGKTTWPDVMAEVYAERGQEAPGPEAPKKTGLEGATETLRAKAAAAQPAAAEVQTTPNATGKVDPATCAHRDAPTLQPGEIGNCPECSAEIVGEPPREPGSDDVPPGVVADIRNLAGRAGDTTKAAPKGGRIKE